MATQVTVRGSYSAFQQPERATVHARLALEGPALGGRSGRHVGRTTGFQCARAAASAGGDGELALTPEDIEISAIVDARFVAGQA